MRKYLAALLMGLAANACSSSTPDAQEGGAACDARCESSCAPPTPGSLCQIGHVIVIYLENHSFDNLYGSYPGAEGLSSSAAKIAQIDKATGQPYDTLPRWDPNITEDLPNEPFDITRFIALDQPSVDPDHLYYKEQRQINGGKMDSFVTESNFTGFSFGFYPTSALPLARLMANMPGQVTVCDHFFHAAFGGSFLNHFWLIAAATPQFPNAPPWLVATRDAQGRLADGTVTPDGYAVNAVFSANAPRNPAPLDEELIPNQTFPTIGDRLNDAGVDWAWYAGGWDDALAGRPDSSFAYHHQPFVYFANYADGTAQKARHLKDEADFITAVAAGTLPAVSFVKPLGISDEHPGRDLLLGENHAVELIQRVRASSLWNDTAIIVTYDENGGFWDHVPPPIVDQWGPGVRVPALIFSRFAKGGVDATPYDTTAVLALIEKRWNLPSLGARDAAQADLSTHALDLGSVRSTTDADAPHGPEDASEHDAIEEVRRAVDADTMSSWLSAGPAPAHTAR